LEKQQSEGLEEEIFSLQRESPYGLKVQAASHSLPKRVKLFQPVYDGLFNPEDS